MLKDGELVHCTQNHWLAIVSQDEKNFIVIRRASGEIPESEFGTIEINPEKTMFGTIKAIKPKVVTYDHPPVFFVEARYLEKKGSGYIERCDFLNLFSTFENAILFCQRPDVQRQCKVVIPEEVEVIDWFFAIMQCKPDPEDADIGCLANRLVLTLDKTGKPTQQQS